MKRTPTNLLMLCFCLLVAFVAAACGDDTPALTDDEVTKDKARELMASSRTTDLCAERGWYGDGTCDDFCPEVDPDCGPTESVDPVERVDLEPVYNPCGGKTCGDTCNLCAPNDPDCIETAVVKYCTVDGACSARMPDCPAEAEPYNPCAGKTCGEQCTRCSPDDPDCIETAVVKFCNTDGACSPHMPLCEVDQPEPEPYNPCGGKTCGETCTICSPDDPDCFETAVVKFCNADGGCSPHMPECSVELEPQPEPYIPCAGKTCGEQCSHCPPNDPDCIETAVVKYCTSEGLCSPRMPACSM